MANIPRLRAVLGRCLDTALSSGILPYAPLSSSAVAKTIKHCDETGSHEGCHRKGRPRVTSATELESPASEIGN